MEVQKDQVRTIQKLVGIDLLYEPDHLFTVRDDMKVAVNCPVFKGLAD